MSSHNDPIFYAFMGFGTGIYFFFHGFKVLKRKHLMENTPTSKVRSLAMGPCEVYGEAKPGTAGFLKSPFSSHDCLYYNFEIEEYRDRGKNSCWVTVRKGSEGVPFLLKDHTGEVLVNPAEAEVDIPADNIFHSGTGQDVHEGIAAFLEKHNLSSTGFFGWNKRMRYTESFVSIGDNLYILGTAMDNPYVDEASAEQGHMDVMIAHANGNLFYISDKSEKDCLRDQASSVFLQIWGGAALTLVCLAYSLYRFGLFG